MKTSVLGRLAAICSMIAVALALVLASGLVSWQESATAQSPKKRYVGNREIIVDKDTGKARKPTEAEVEELVSTLSSLTNRSTEGLSVTQRADGVKQMSLDGRFNGVTLARPREDGSMEVLCVMTFEEGAAFLGLEEVD